MGAVEIATLALLPVFLIVDLLLPRHGGGLRGWRTRAAVVTAVNFALSLWLGTAYSALFGDFHVFDGANLGTAGGAVVGVLTYELCHYWYHRSAHRWTWLWRLGHQMHHSAESLDAWGAYYLHPLDAAIFLSLSSIVLFPLLGLTPQAGAWASAALTFFAIFQHARVRTPRWMGFLVQRPESHAIHHQRGVHAFNYSDLPLWDMMFGTYRNPAGQVPVPTQGFYDGASARILDMLAFRDVSSRADVT
jgi:sterol desaturase/sphingolipid hydroxylase (fatty acid hydroxylase superfamily)